MSFFAESRTLRPIRACSLVLVALMLISVFALAGCRASADDSASQPSSTEFKQTDAALNPDEYVLVVGDDSWGSYVPGRSDLMLLMRMDVENQQVYLVTIPRDTAYVYSDGSTIKANHAYLYDGVDGALAAASAITGVDVNQYVVLGFDGLQSIVDYFGGLDINLPYAIEYSFYTQDYPNEAYAEGEQTLTPWRAMALSRARTGYTQYGLNEDMMRQVVDRQMFSNLMESALMDSNGAAAVVRNLYSCVDTNISADQLASWAEQYAGFDQITVYGTSGPVDGDVDPASELWLVPYDAGKWSELMGVVDSGGDPSTVNAQFAGNVQSDRAPINSKVVIGG